MLLIEGEYPFYFQERPGRNGRIFKIFKFKTMNNNCDSYGNLLPGIKRITKIGGWMRKLSLDELPQLFNILKGDMSIVGPRPLLIEYLNLYDETQARRHDVKPGITGLAQIKGRNSISWNEKFEYDVWYVDHISLWLDMRIIFLTILKVAKADGVNAAENVTMEKFVGRE